MKIYIVLGSLFESMSDDGNIVAIFKDKKKAEDFCIKNNFLDFYDNPHIVERCTDD